MVEKLWDLRQDLGEATVMMIEIGNHLEDIEKIVTNVKKRLRELSSLIDEMIKEVEEDG